MSALLILRSPPQAGVSKDGSMLGLMVRDAQRCAPHHEGEHFGASSRFAFGPPLAATPGLGAFAQTTLMIASSLSTQLSSSGLTGRSSTPRPQSMILRRLWNTGSSAFADDDE